MLSQLKCNFSLAKCSIKSRHESEVHLYSLKVTVKDHTGSRYVFNCGEWLQKRSGEDSLQAELALSEQVLDQVSAFKGKGMEYLKLNEDQHLSAIEETVHENLTNVLQGIINSNSDEDSLFTQSSNSVASMFVYFNSIKLSKSATVICWPTIHLLLACCFCDTIIKVSFLPDDGHEKVSSNGQLAPMLPAARLLVEAFGLARGHIPATGPKGHLLKGDVLKYIVDNKVPKLDLQGSVKQDDSFTTKKPLQPDAKTARQPPEGLWKCPFCRGSHFEFKMRSCPKTYR